MPIGVGAGKLLGVRRIFAQISPNLPEKTPKKMTSKKRKKQLHFISCWAHFFKSKHLKHNFARILPNLPEKYFKIVTSEKKLLMSIRAPFLVNSGAIIFKSKHVGHHIWSDFKGILEDSQIFCPDFTGFCPDFMGFFPDLQQIKIFGGAVAPSASPPPAPVPMQVSHIRRNLHCLFV